MRIEVKNLPVLGRVGLLHEFILHLCLVHNIIPHDHAPVDDTNDVRIGFLDELARYRIPVDMRAQSFFSLFHSQYIVNDPKPGAAAVRAKPSPVMQQDKCPLIRGINLLFHRVNLILDLRECLIQLLLFVEYFPVVVQAIFKRGQEVIRTGAMAERSL